MNGDIFINNGGNYPSKMTEDNFFLNPDNISYSSDSMSDTEKLLQTAKDIRNTAKSAQHHTNGLEDNSPVHKASELSGNALTGKMSTKLSGRVSVFSFFSEYIISKLPSKIVSMIELKRSLTKLRNISDSVDELMAQPVLYGESQEKYAQLSRYIVRANSLQGEISKFLKK